VQPTFGVLIHTTSSFIYYLKNETGSELNKQKLNFRGINPSENRFVAFITSGEGWHNYHHVFPWDYKASELGNYGTNTTRAIIDFCAWLGLAYDLKSVPEIVVHNRVRRTGDGSHPFALEDDQFRLGDIQMEEEQFTEITPAEEKRCV